MSFIATKPLLLADQFSNGSDLPDLTTIQEYKEALPRSKQRLISFHPIDPSSQSQLFLIEILSAFAFTFVEYLPIVVFFMQKKK